ncbi:MAG: prepilin peptidase [Actinomycetes bacterium]
MLALVALVAVVGLMIGSFLNGVIWRVPRGESVVTPRSHCPSCGHMVRPRDDVPVVSWLLLRGKCRDCSAPISSRYPLVELSTAVLFVIVTLRFGADWRLPAYLYLAAAAVALTMIDIDHHRLPNAIVLPSYGVLLALLLLPVVFDHDTGALLRALIGGLALFAFYVALVLVYPAGMGVGDVQLAGVLGLALGFLGWGQLAVGAFLGFLLGGVYSVGLVLARRAGRKTAIPFGPFMLSGALLAVLVGGVLSDLYLNIALGG